MGNVEYSQDARKALTGYVLGLADDCLVLGQRVAEWLGHAPAMELDIACSNLSLDLIGQAQFYYEYAGELENAGRSADDLAFMRDEHEYRNHLLVEQLNGDFGKTIVRHYLFSQFSLLRSNGLAKSNDPKIAAIAQKSVRELEYHVKFSADWVRRLALGTEEGHSRIQTAIDDLWSFTSELFNDVEQESALFSAGLAVAPSMFEEEWCSQVNSLFAEAGIKIPEHATLITKGRMAGHHTEHLGHLLAEMQFLQRAYPGLAW